MAFLYENLNSKSSAGDIASAYQQWASANGGDTAANRGTAEKYLQNLGVLSPTINSAYDLYKNGPAPAAPQNLGFGNPFKYDQKNPYLQQMAGTITGQVNENLMRNVMPQINSSAMAAGQFGGSRQGVVQANAMRDANQQLSNSLTGMYYGDYNNAMNRQLQKYGMDQQYDLGLRGNDLGWGQLDLATNNSNVQNQLAGANLGLNAYNTLMNGNSTAINAGNQMWNTPLGYYGNFANTANSIARQGGVTNQSYPSNPGAQWMGAGQLLGAAGRYFGGYNTNDGYGYSYQQGGTGGAPTATGSANFLAPY